MTQVKICGLKRPEDALVAAEAGADMLGLVFAPSPRRITAERAREIVDVVRERWHPAMVGVFVNESPQEMNRIARFCRLDYAQLSGEEADDVVAALDLPAIRTLHVNGTLSAETMASCVAELRCEMVLLDTARAGSYGGTGATFDWSLVAGVGRDVMLAGGLHPGNVSEAVRVVRPWGVDVSSGVETDGEKDPAKIREFVRAAKRVPVG